MLTVIDSTVWIDFFRGSPLPEVGELERTIRRHEAMVGDLILAEVLQGIPNENTFKLVRSHLEEFPIYNMVGRDVAIESANNFRRLRRRGFTVRKTIDCMIATFCIENQLQLLHNDRDFEVFERELGLRVLHP